MTQGGSTVTTRFAYDGREIWADLTSTNSLQTRYVRGERVLELLARIAGGTVAWILADRMGSVRNVVGNTGAVIDTISYDGYGNITNESSPSNGGHCKYDGYRYDSETGWYRPDPTVGRYYVSSVGGWFGQDSLGFLAGDANLYRYVVNNPVNAMDPSGLDVYVFWVEGARFDIEKKESPNRVLYNNIIKPLMDKYKDQKKLHWVRMETGWGAVAKQRARIVEEGMRKRCDNKDSVVLIGYSWGGWIVVEALEMMYINKAGFRQKPFTVDIVYTIDPVAGNPLRDANKTQFGHESRDKRSGAKIVVVYGQFKEWYNWYQQVEKKTAWKEPDLGTQNSRWKGQE